MASIIVNAVDRVINMGSDIMSTAFDSTHCGSLRPHSFTPPFFPPPLSLSVKKRIVSRVAGDLQLIKPTPQYEARVLSLHWDTWSTCWLLTVLCLATVLTSPHPRQSTLYHLHGVGLQLVQPGPGQLSDSERVAVRHALSAAVTSCYRRTPSRDPGHSTHPRRACLAAPRRTESAGSPRI